MTNDINAKSGQVQAVVRGLTTDEPATAAQGASASDTAYIIWSISDGFLLHTLSSNRQAAWNSMSVTKRLAKEIGWRCVKVRLSMMG